MKWVQVAFKHTNNEGMGKTIETISLLLVQKKRGKSNGQTLVVCSVTLMSQWLEEIETHSSLTCGFFYGSDRSSGFVIDNLGIDVVLTTYGTLASEFTNKGEKSKLFSVEWSRVVLDEVLTMRH